MQNLLAYTCLLVHLNLWKNLWCQSTITQPLSLFRTTIFWIIVQYTSAICRWVKKVVQLGFSLSHLPCVGLLLILRVLKRVRVCGGGRVRGWQVVVLVALGRPNFKNLISRKKNYVLLMTQRKTILLNWLLLWWFDFLHLLHIFLPWIYDVWSKYRLVIYTYNIH